MSQTQSPVDIPSRQGTQFSTFSDDAVPETDPSNVSYLYILWTPPNRQSPSSHRAADIPPQTAGLLAERLQAWKHAVVYLEEYMEAVEKAHKAQSKEYEKVLKVRSRNARAG